MKIISSQIINMLGYVDIIQNEDIEINGVSTIGNIKKNTIIFFKKYSEELAEIVNNIENCFIILKQEYKSKIKFGKNTYVFAENPRYEYARVVNAVLKNEEKNKMNIQLINGSYISEFSNIHESVFIEPTCYIGNNVKIGKNTIIMAGAKIKDNVTIGENCIIRENCVIGGFGFGFEKDKSGINYRIPHIGGVIIEDNVEVGAITTICSGTINPTIIKNYVKIDDHVHIAHNCVIGENCTITACAEISGSCIVGKNTWIAPNTSVINGITIGENVTIGMGAVINKSVNNNEVMVGSPAEPLEDAKKFRKIKIKMMSEV
ncbi:UDP-3-O-(3-hydroxymyristoyl)glucosamine N-acyltransferase [Clostridium gasigenes]|uniref:UDP-3-O-(3-hydroxymyristoyl)glucosamine N-acyltransferase n=1 Tax=Clostridium gasigenes TaxID=94869 RepID=UPI00143855F2|nr:UDP-3-O-(3-hydroxymyristoyl)glucosamine N-acyltransferase [Clostridium gasigenes]NKF08485.1 UDP-3-O-(3-hydroxymyristoyl)glucosamine N-acyltransferase [Clostridium gasigenes]QSW21300.1 UDP-3-O-(3-hydroxymyristoyl)glucosamine N-acyltransferase [Clostridium gasigenes]